MTKEELLKILSKDEFPSDSWICIENKFRAVFDTENPYSCFNTSVPYLRIYETGEKLKLLKEINLI